MKGHACSGTPEYIGTIALGERGQVVIPKELREHLGLKTGSKLVLLQHDKGFIALKAEEMKALMDKMSSDFKMILKDV
jgi:AbrB family looped-hinge helix DNA binding protein